MEQLIDRIKLPIIYCVKLFLMNSKSKLWLSKLVVLLTNGPPTIIETNIIKGIKGGKVTCDDMNVNNLFSLK